MSTGKLRNNRELRLVFLCVLSFFAAVHINAQKPLWIDRPPRSLHGNDTYAFVVIDADAQNLDIGRKKCLQMLSLDRGLLNTVTMSYKSEDLIKSTQRVENGNFSENLETKTLEIITTEGKPIQIKAKIVDEYFNDNRMTTLYQVGTISSPIFDNTYVTTHYGIKGLWRSVIIPGWGQFYKRSYLKGGLILGGSTLLAGGIVYTECMRAGYWKKQRNGYATTDSQKQFYYKKEKDFALARNIVIGGLCAFYVYNLVDAIVAPGARYVKVSRTDRYGNVYTMTPTVGFDGTPMLSGTIRF